MKDSASRFDSDLTNLNGFTRTGRERFASLIESADSIELNMNGMLIDPGEGGGIVENRKVELGAAVQNVVQIPLAVKIGPYFSSLSHIVNSGNSAEY